MVELKFKYDALGFITGVTGASLLALNNPHYSSYGFICFLASNAAWIVYALQTKQKCLLYQTFAFSVTSAIGVFNWLW